MHKIFPIKLHGYYYKRFSKYYQYMHVKAARVFTAVEKNNDTCKRILRTKSNKWNPTKDILQIQQGMKRMEETSKRKK